MLPTFQNLVQFKNFVWTPEHVLRSKATRCSKYEKSSFREQYWPVLTHNSGRVTQICVFNTVKLDTSASSP